jgi:hypothetical protein
VNIAGAQGVALQIAELVEHEQGMIAGAFVMAVPGAQLLFAVRRADARIHVEHDASGRTAAMNLVDPSADRFFAAVRHRVSNRPIWLGEAAQP